MKRTHLALWLGIVTLALTGCVGAPQGGKLTQEGAAALEAGDYAEAKEKYEQALESGEDEVPAYRGLGIADMGLASYEEAVESFETALSYTDKKMPDTIRDIKKYLAGAALKAGDYSEVVSTCTDLLQEEPDAEVYYCLGAAYLGQNDKDQAKENFASASELAGKNYELYLQIYRCYVDRNLSGVGDEYLQKALKIQPEDQEDKYQIGRIYYYLEQYSQAQQILADGVAAGHEASMELMGQVYLAQDDYANAQAMYQAMLSQNGETPAGYNGLAQCALASGDYDQALQHIASGLALDNEDGKMELRFNEIVAYERKNDFQTAYVKAQAYVELYPGDESGQKELTFLSTRV